VIGVTGANGYVGARIISHLRAEGIEAIGLVRRPEESEPGARRYALAEPIDASLLDGIDTLVHAAYDLGQRGANVRRVNFCGSLPLIDGVAARGGRIVLISSLSAFNGARSRYGRTKLELEGAVLQRGGVVIRPGLVFGRPPRGLFGAMVAAISRRAVVPLIGGGWQRMYLSHDERLCELVAGIVDRQREPELPLFAAHEVPSSLWAIAAQIAAARGARLRAIPIPSSLAYLGLRGAEIAGFGLPFRSDSVRSLTNPIPLDQAAALARAPVRFPALSPELWLESELGVAT
jgi:nucleoside-diphosphate-sugar epimerase